MSKYGGLAYHFQTLPGSNWHTTFEEIERIAGFPLPASAREHRAWWANTSDHTPQKRCWMDAGWQTRDVNLTAGRVLFVRAAGPLSHPNLASDPARDVSALTHSTASKPYPWDEARMVECRLGLTWEPLGRAVLGSDGKLAFPAADAAPALYCFRILQGNTERRYIGQTENLWRRFGHYRNPGPAQQTNTRLNAEFTQALAEGAEIGVSVVVDGAWIETQAGRVEADMASVITRCLLENAAILQSGASDIESLNRGHSPQLEPGGVPVAVPVTSVLLPDAEPQIAASAGMSETASPVKKSGWRWPWLRR